MTLSRRTFLTSSGVALALPMLESMNPAFGKAKTPPKRMIFMCTALGLHPPSLFPKKSGPNYEETPYLKLLNEHRKDFTLFGGLSHRNQTGRQPHDSEITFLTSVEKPGMDGFRNTISVDQLAASRLGYVTRFPSITLGTRTSQSQSYTSGGVMIPAQTSPARLFAQLFLKGKPRQVAEQQRKLQEGRSILDELKSQTKTIRRKASATDNHLLADYFDSIRRAETNISKVQGWMKKPKPKTDAEQPEDIPDAADLIGRTQLLMDIVPLVIQSDSSRVVSVMVQDHFVKPRVPGVEADHHSLSHHGRDKKKIEQLMKIESLIVECFASLLTQMKSKKEAGKTLLDRTSILFGSNLGNANAHHANNLPIFLAGGGFKHGRYVTFDRKNNKPLSNLFLTMLNNSGIEANKFGQSTGTLRW